MKKIKPKKEEKNEDLPNYKYEDIIPNVTSSNSATPLHGTKLDFEGVVNRVAARIKIFKNERLTTEKDESCLVFDTERDRRIAMEQERIRKLREQTQQREIESKLGAPKVKRHPLREEFALAGKVLENDLLRYMIHNPTKVMT